MTPAAALHGHEVDPFTGSVGPLEWSSTLAEFEESNAEDAASLAQVRALGVGDAVELGGGACPLVLVRRVS